METASIIINVIFLLALTCPAATLSLGLDSKHDNGWGKNLTFALTFALAQGVLGVLGSLLGSTFMYLMDAFSRYLVFAMMLVVAIRLFLDSFKIIKGKRLVTFSSNAGLLLLAAVAGINVFLMTLTAPFFSPFGKWYYIAIVAAGFLWSMISIRIPYSNKTFKGTSFLEFSASIFLIVIALLYLFTDLIY